MWASLAEVEEDSFLKEIEGEDLFKFSSFTSLLGISELVERDLSPLFYALLMKNGLKLLTTKN